MLKDINIFKQFSYEKNMRVIGVVYGYNIGPDFPKGGFVRKQDREGEHIIDKASGFEVGMIREDSYLVYTDTTLMRREPVAKAASDRLLALLEEAEDYTGCLERDESSKTA